MAKQVKVGGRKLWNNGWSGRQGVNRSIERAFRQTARAEIEAGLAEAEAAKADKARS